MVLASHASVLPHRPGRAAPHWKDLLQQTKSRLAQSEEKEMEKARVGTRIFKKTLSLFAKI